MLNDSIARFTPAADGLDSFSFTVTDAEGSTMTRTTGIVAQKVFAYPALSNFEARRLGMKEVALQWGTVQEINNPHFVIYRSIEANGRNAVAIDTLYTKTRGNSTLPQTYDHIDSNALSVQYRDVNIEVIDAMGRPVLSKKLADNSTSTFYLSKKGIYWLRVTGFGTVGTILYTRLLVVL